MLTQVRNLNQRLATIIWKEFVDVVLLIRIGNDFVGHSRAENMVYDLFPTVKRPKLCFPEYPQDRKSLKTGGCGRPFRLMMSHNFGGTFKKPMRPYEKQRIHNERKNNLRRLAENQSAATG
jgi:hypothetical protein